MSKKVIHIYGASGSGTSTIGKYISVKMELLFYGYWWLLLARNQSTLYEKEMFQNDYLWWEKI